MGPLRTFIFKNEYKYYDTPEGEDCHRKLWYVTKYCGIYGLGYSAIDTLLYSHPKGYISTLGRYAYITFPFMGLGASFVASVCLATNMRKKDDLFNYAFGGATVGGLFGAWQKSVRVGCYSAFFFGLIGAAVKDAIDNDYPIYDTKTQGMFTNPWALQRDFSITQDPGKTWK